MLVLSRRAGESILIGDQIEIRVLQVRGSGPSAVVRLGIVAPPEVKVLRAEVVEAVREENRLAARPLGIQPEALQGLLRAVLERRGEAREGSDGPEARGQGQPGSGQTGGAGAGGAGVPGPKEPSEA
ncbi:MAG: carbon storage regulator [Bacillota bacterium]